MKTIAISIDEDMLRRIDLLGAATNRSQLIRKAVQEYLTHIESVGEEEREREIFKRHRRTLERQAIALVKEQAKS